MVRAEELRKKFIDFFVRHGHKELLSASLVPENDPTALFINSGMHPLVPYLMGEAHPLGKRLVSVQKCVRTNDIDEVGDTTHHTFFEMLGNWSLGDYFKQQAIEFSFRFLTEELNLEKERLAVTVFAGDKDAPRDDEAAEIWRSLGIPDSRIFYLPKSENWWQVGPVGPCGPDTEVMYDTDPSRPPCGSHCGAGCDCGKYFEIWNNVFMVFNRKENGDLEELPQKNVDTGLGLERTLAILNGFSDNYRTDLFWSSIELISELVNKKYEAENDIRLMRVVADHVRAACFIMADGVVSSNKDQGYILRRLIRRAVRYGKLLGGSSGMLSQVAGQVIKQYGKRYKELEAKKRDILLGLENEEKKFGKSLDRALRVFDKVVRHMGNSRRIEGKQAFFLYETYALPLEIIKELAGARGLEVDESGFEKARREHQQKSRAGLDRKFKGGLLDTSQETVRLHTLTHLLHEALRRVLDEEVKQVGSNITPERLRFDFEHGQKLSAEQIAEVEKMVNEQIGKDLAVSVEEMDYKEAVERGALAFFGERYPPKVKVYSIGDFSCEICGGPHVSNTSEIGGKLEIFKCEKIGEGKVRIYGRIVKKLMVKC